MRTKQEIESRLAQLVEEYGDWAFDIPLLHGVWTRGNQKIPHTRLKRILQIAGDLSTRSLSSCRILDLGCLDGMFSIECALQGASVVGIEAREANIKKALFAAEILGLNNLKFIQDDVRNLSLEKYGKFDIILCSGILYHLNTPDVFNLIEKMYEVVQRLVIIDTHVSLTAGTTVDYKGKKYYGYTYREHADNDGEDTKLMRSLASFKNNTSFWFTRPSLINFLSYMGFSSIYECFNPPHLNFGNPGLECKDRCTFVAIKGQKLPLLTSPLANSLEEDWPEASLIYSP